MSVGVMKDYIETRLINEKFASGKAKKIPPIYNIYIGGKKIHDG